MVVLRGWHDRSLQQAMWGFHHQFLIVGMGWRDQLLGLVNQLCWMMWRLRLVDGGPGNLCCHSSCERHQAQKGEENDAALHSCVAFFKGGCYWFQFQIVLLYSPTIISLLVSTYVKEEYNNIQLFGAKLTIILKFLLIFLLILNVNEYLVDCKIFFLFIKAFITSACYFYFGNYVHVDSVHVLNQSIISNSGNKYIVV